MTKTRTSEIISTRLAKITNMARKYRDTALTSLSHHIDIACVAIRVFGDVLKPGNGIVSIWTDDPDAPPANVSVIASPTKPTCPPI